MKGFGDSPLLYKVVIKWKHGFQHNYEQKLTIKQLETEQERLNNYRWIESFTFEDLTETA